MKPIRIVLSPTRSRPANIFLGMVLVLVSLLLLLSLATYHASDPSLNTAAGSTAPRNWIGLFGAYISDLLLQSLGLTAFFLPIWLGGLGWTWMRSRPGGSPILRWVGTLLALTFLPAVFGLLPWHWRWLHVIPVEGVVGRLTAGLLVVYLNLQGAWVLAGVLAAAGLYFASAISFWVIRESIADRWARFSAWRERRRDLRAELRAEREALREERDQPVPFPQFAADAGSEIDDEPAERQPGRFFAFFHRKRAAASDPLDEIPAYQRADLRQRSGEPAAPAAFESCEPPIPVTLSRKPSIWERPAPELAAKPAIPELAAAPAYFQPTPAPMQPQPAAARLAANQAASWPRRTPRPFPRLYRRTLAKSPFMAAPMQTCAPSPWLPRT